MGSTERQRKQITVLFADISGFTAMSEAMDVEDVSEVMNTLWQQLDAAIVAQGGHIDKHIGDAVMAYWGATGTREDDPARAIRAALNMQAELHNFRQTQQSETSLRMRIGINTGPALLGKVGTTEEFTAMGDTVNTASRLEHAAPVGGILISHATYQHVRNLFEVTKQKPLTAKGKKEPLQVYTVERAKPHSFRVGTRGIEGLETRMIGREAELERLQDMFYDTVQNQALQAMTVIGEAGVGKSRLLREFDAWLTALPKQTSLFRGRAGQELQVQPYALFRDVFMRHFKIQDSDSRQVVQSKLEDGISTILGVDEDSRKQAHFIGYLLGFDIDDSLYLEQDQENARPIRDQAMTYVGAYFKAAAAINPIIIFLEDIHWADESSLTLIGQLLPEMAGHPLMLVCLARPQLFDRHPQWGMDQAFHHRLTLPLLTQEEAHLLVSEILQKVEEIPATLQELIVEGSQGNPFYIEELIKMLLEDEVIITGRSAWLVHPARLSKVRIPPTLIGVLQTRLDSLDKMERTILQRAAIIGRAFWDEVLAYLGDDTSTDPSEDETNEPKVQQILHNLEERGLIRQQETAVLEGMREYIFKNVLFREITYESVLKRERRAYHDRVAQWLINNSGDRTQEHASLIAKHLEQAQKNPEAIIYLQYAGEQAQKTSAFQESLNFFKRALALLAASDRRERMILTRQISRALYELGNWDAAKEQLQESLQIARTMADPKEIAKTLYDLGGIAEKQGKYLEAKENLQESLLSARMVADPQQIVASLRALGNVAEKQGQYAEAKGRLEESLALAQRYSDQISAAQTAYIQNSLDNMSGAVETAKTRVRDRFAQVRVSERKKRLGESLRTLGGFARQTNTDEEE